MTVKEFCGKYKISHQAVYAKLRKKADVLKGHIRKCGCLVLDDFAVEIIKPTSADNSFFQESEKLKSELSRKNIDFENLQSELYFQNEKIAELEKMLNDKNSEIEDLQKSLAEQNSKVEIFLSE